MFKKTAFVAIAAAGLMMIGSPAFAGGGGHGTKIKDNVYQHGLLNVNNVLNENYLGLDLGVLQDAAVPVAVLAQNGVINN